VQLWDTGTLCFRRGKIEGRNGAAEGGINKVPVPEEARKERKKGWGVALASRRGISGR